MRRCCCGLMDIAQHLRFQQWGAMTRDPAPRQLGWPCPCPSTQLQDRRVDRTEKEGRRTWGLTWRTNDPAG